MTPMLKSTLAAGKKALDERSKPWTLPGLGGELLVEVKCKAAKILNSKPTDISWVTSTSAACSTAAYNFIELKKLRKNTKIVIVEDQFWSNVFPWQQAAQKVGAEIVAVKADSNGDFTPGIMKQLKENENVIVTIPTALWSNGSVLDLTTIGNCIKEHRSKKDLGFFIDATQTMGVVPFDAEAIDPDFFCASTYKWLMGDMPGTVLYVKRDPWHTKGVPLDFHMTNTEKFGQGLTNVTQLSIKFKHVGLNEYYTPALVESAARFDNGGNPERVKYSLLEDSLEQIISWGVPNIEATCKEHTRKVEQFFDNWNQRLKKKVFWYPQNHVANIIGVKHIEDKEFPDALAQFLKERNVMVASRFGYLRISPFVHNTAAELEKMFGYIDEFIRARYPETSSAKKKV